MDGTKKKVGRPPKNGAIEPWRFGRAVQVIYAYTKARDSGEKHSAAVKEAVKFVRRQDPETPISESEVKRVLAELLPRNGSALLVDYSLLEGEEAAETRRYYEQLLAQAGAQNLTKLSIQDPKRPLKQFKIKLVDRPKYPRHNAKSSSS